jgi:hypothetical protein
MLDELQLLDLDKQMESDVEMMKTPLRVASPAVEIVTNLGQSSSHSESSTPMDHAIPSPTKLDQDEGDARVECSSPLDSAV